MSDISQRAGSQISDAALPVPYVTNYTNKTPTLGPLALTVIKAWAILMIEWGSLRWIDHAPIGVWISSSLVALLVLGVIERREWLNFKNKRFFPISLSGLLIAWAGIVAFAYYYDAVSDHPANPAVVSLQSQLATALRARDAAVVERDNARRANNVTAPPASSTTSSPPGQSDTDARKDVWEGISSLMNDFEGALNDSDAITANWKANQAGLSKSISEFRQKFTIARNKLGQFIGTYPNFSDLRIIDQGIFTKFATVIENALAVR